MGRNCTPSLYKRPPTASVLILFRGCVFVSFEKRSHMTNRYLFPFRVFGNGPKISIQINSKGETAGNSLQKLVCFRSLMRFSWQDTHSRIFWYASIDMEGQ